MNRKQGVRTDMYFARNRNVDRNAKSPRLPRQNVLWEQGRAYPGIAQSCLVHSHCGIAGTQLTSACAIQIRER